MEIIAALIKELMQLDLRCVDAHPIYHNVQPVNYNLLQARLVKPVMIQLKLVHQSIAAN